MIDAGKSRAARAAEMFGWGVVIALAATVIPGRAVAMFGPLFAGGAL